MTWSAIWIGLLSLVFGQFKYVHAQCDGSPSFVTPNFPANSTTFTVQLSSPHYPIEYNKTADCEWALNNREHSAEVLLDEKRLHFEDPYGRKYCSGSYDIFVNGDKLDCLPSVDITPNSIFDSNCGTNSTSTMVQIAYRSDGRTLGYQNITGFKMIIKFTKCSTSTNGSDSQIEVTQPPTRRYTSTTSAGNLTGNPEEPMVATIIALGALCGLLTLLMLAVVIFLLHQRFKGSSKPSHYAAPGDPAVVSQPSPPPEESTEPVYDDPPTETEQYYNVEAGYMEPHCPDDTDEFEE